MAISEETLSCPNAKFHAFRPYEIRVKDFDDEGEPVARKDVEFFCIRCGLPYKDAPPLVNRNTGEQIGRLAISLI